MLIVILTNHALFAELASYIHTRFIAPLIARQRYGIARPFLYLSFLLMLSSHLVEISIWGYVLSLTGLVPDLHKALFFSASTYTTLGYGKDIMPEAWKPPQQSSPFPACSRSLGRHRSFISMVAIFHNRKTPLSIQPIGSRCSFFVTRLCGRRYSMIQKYSPFVCSEDFHTSNLSVTPRYHF